MAATNVSVSGGLNLLDLINFIDNRRQRSQARPALRGLEPTPGGPLNIPTDALSNPYVLQAVEALTGARGRESASRVGERNAASNEIGALASQLQAQTDAKTAPVQAQASARNSRANMLSARSGAKIGQQNADTSRMNAQSVAAEALGRVGDYLSMPGYPSGIFGAISSKDPFSGIRTYLDALAAKEEQARRDLAAPPGKGKPPGAGVPGRVGTGAETPSVPIGKAIQNFLDSLFGYSATAPSPTTTPQPAPTSQPAAPTRPMQPGLPNLRGFGENILNSIQDKGVLAKKGVAPGFGEQIYESIKPRSTRTNQIVRPTPTLQNNTFAGPQPSTFVVSPLIRFMESAMPEEQAIAQALPQHLLEGKSVEEIRALIQQIIKQSGMRNPY